MFVEIVNIIKYKLLNMISIFININLFILVFKVIDIRHYEV